VVGVVGVVFGVTVVTVVGAAVVVGATVVVGAAVVDGVTVVVDRPAASLAADEVPQPAARTNAAAAASAGLALKLIGATHNQYPEPARDRHAPRVWGLTIVAAMAALVAAGCGSATRHAAGPGHQPGSPAGTSAPTSPAVTTSIPPTTTAPPTTVPATTTTTIPSFTDTVDAVAAAQVPYTWRAGCPVGPAQLRMLHMTYWGFDGQAHTGTMVVNASVVDDVAAVFRTLYDEHFPIQEMVPEDAYHGNDNLAAAADDTSGFNCRLAVATGPPQWSVHAYGEAIDVNDVQNPYVFGSTIIPPTGASFLNRGDVRPGMAVLGGELVEAFASVGWQWGGRWTASPDYQHFSLTGG
jgi:hypothetical protein